MTLNLDLIHPFCFIQAWENGAGCISLPCCLKPCISLSFFLPFPSSHCFTSHTQSLLQSLFPHTSFGWPELRQRTPFVCPLTVKCKTYFNFHSKIFVQKKIGTQKLSLCSLMLPSGGLSHSLLPWRFSLWKHLLISRLSRPSQCQCSPLCLRRGENIPL